jgi:ribosomal protein L16 Arg81 hydroxylase
MEVVKVIKGYNYNTASWEEAFYNLNDSISKNELVKKPHDGGFLKSHNAERINCVQDVLNDLGCQVAHLYIGIDITNSGFGNHVDEVDVWSWQNKGVTKWDFQNGDSYTVNEGDLIHIPKGVYHKASSVTARFSISMFNPIIIMTRQEFNELAQDYGTDKAKKAMTWLSDNTTADFRKGVYIVGFLKSNEILWN